MSSTARSLHPVALAPMSDSEVTRRVAAGETALFEILMRRYNQRLFRAVRAIVPDDAEAEEAVQQAWIAAWNALGRFEGRASIATWLTRIAIHEALRRRRRTARELERADETADAERFASSAPGPEERAMTSELRSILEREIDALPEAYRTVVMLREVEGLDTAETAEALGVTQDVVKTRLHRAKGMLRDRLVRRSAAAITRAFAFADAGCDRIVAAVLSRIGAPSKTPKTL
ncbi:MAG TPA: RNA polymerase sigma factor [Thermoanaerobaculia bacterium]|nr:RNA polymerase sigma factor [Thermoanaerobaculia bacterium]